MSSFKRDVAIIGGAGHVGLPLALAFANRGLQTVIFDSNIAALNVIRSGKMPFTDEGAPELLTRVLARGKLDIHSDAHCLSDCRFVVLVIGTPVDEHLNPTFTSINRVIKQCIPYLRDGQILVLRSTVFPGISRHIRNMVRHHGLEIEVAFCPERITQGYALKEFGMYPQIISAFDPGTLKSVRELFVGISPEFIEMEPMEAEVCKLMTNAWRYIQFATVNQFYIIATTHGLDFSRILHGCRHNYGRMADAPGPGFAAGPCLVKDTMQLAAFSRDQFMLGHAAMLINESLPAHLIDQCKREIDLSQKTTGILGMAFKANSDDTRDSLSYKLRKLLMLESRSVLCSDPHAPDPLLVPEDRVLSEADVIFIGVPHREYRELILRPDQKLVDVWSCVESARQPFKANRPMATS